MLGRLKPTLYRIPSVVNTYGNTVQRVDVRIEGGTKALPSYRMLERMEYILVDIQQRSVIFETVDRPLSWCDCLFNMLKCILVALRGST